MFFATRARCLLVVLWIAFPAYGNDVEIVGADFQRQQDGSWTINVALLHADDGWNHYADLWRLVDSEGNVLGERKLLHPHDDEQPFARSTSGVRIPKDSTALFLEAHDSVHGWSPNRLAVDITQAEDGRLRVLPEH